MLMTAVRMLQENSSLSVDSLTILSLSINCQHSVFKSSFIELFGFLAELVDSELSEAFRYPI